MSKFPLPSNFFRCPALNVEESARLLKNAEDISVDLVRYSRVTGGPIKWTLKSDDSCMQIYKGDDPDAPAGIVSWLGVTEVMATIDEVVALFRTDTSEEYKEYCSMFMKDVLDGQILYNLRRRTAENPHHAVSIKWFAMESPLPGFAKPRDWCFLETQHDFELDGKQGWTRAFKSVNLSCCPDLQNSLGLVRGVHHRSGYCFLQSSRPGYLQVSQLIQADPRGKMADVLVDLGMKRRCRIMKGMNTFLRQRRLSQGTFLHEGELVAKESRSKCFVCQRRFGAFSKKGQCRKCGEVVCRRCSQMWEVRVAGSLTKRRVCTACSCDTVEPPTDANTIVDDPNDDQTDSQQNETPRTQPRHLPPNLWVAPAFSPSRSPSAKDGNAMARQLSGLTITDDSTPSTSSNAGRAMQVFKPVQPEMSPYGQTTPRHPQQHRLPPVPNVITLRKEDIMARSTPSHFQDALAPEPHRPEPSRHNPHGPGSTWDDDQQSVFKDDMSNYSESLVSFHQSNHTKRGGPVAMAHQTAPQRRPQPYHPPQSSYDNAYHTSPPQSYPERMAHHVPGYDNRRNAPTSTHFSRGQPAYVNPYVSMQQQQYPQYPNDTTAYMPQHTQRYQTPPPHSHHEHMPPPRQRSYDPRRQQPPAARQPYHPQHHPRPEPPSASYGHPHGPLDPPVRVVPRPDHPQYGYMQRQHQFLQDADGASSVHSYDEGASNQYSSLYSYQPRDLPPPPAPRQATKAIGGERNDLILALPSASGTSAAPSVVLQSVFTHHDRSADQTPRNAP